jgi:hypothetical protein
VESWGAEEGFGAAEETTTVTVGLEAEERRRRRRRTGDFHRPQFVCIYVHDEEGDIDLKIWTSVFFASF